jgi:hypothetical protein
MFFHHRHLQRENGSSWDVEGRRSASITARNKSRKSNGGDGSSGGDGRNRHESSESESSDRSSSGGSDSEHLLGTRAETLHLQLEASHAAEHVALAATHAAEHGALAATYAAEHVALSAAHAAEHVALGSTHVAEHLALNSRIAAAELAANELAAVEALALAQKGGTTASEMRVAVEDSRAIHGGCGVRHDAAGPKIVLAKFVRAGPIDSDHTAAEEQKLAGGSPPKDEF